MKIPFTKYHVKLARAAETKPKDPFDDRWYQEYPFFRGSEAAKLVNAETVRNFAAVFTGVKILSETLAHLPLLLYKKKGDRPKVEAVDHDLYWILKSAPNERQTSLEFREMLMGHLLLRGNGYAQIVRNADNSIHGLYPLHPSRMEVLYDEELRSIVYKYKLKNQQTHIFAPEQIMHLRGPSDNGLVGESFIKYLKESIGTGMQIDGYTSSFYQNNASPAGVLQLAAEQTLGDKGKERIKNDWKQKYGGAYNAGGIIVLEEGMEWKQIGMASQDAEIIATKDDIRRDIAAALGIPPHRLGVHDKGTQSSREQEALDFVTYTLDPLFERWKQVIDRDLLRYEKRGLYYAQFISDSLLKGTQLDRARANAIGRQWSWLTANNARADFNLDPLGPEGDVTLQPLNMIDAKEATEYLLTKNAPTEEEPGTKNELDDNSNPSLKNAAPHPVGVVLRAVEELRENVRFLSEMVKNGEKSSQTAPKQQKSSRDFLGSIRPSMEIIVAENMRRLLYKESEAAQRAHKKGTLEAHRSEFLPQHKNLIVDTLCNHCINYVRSIAVVQEMTGEQRKISSEAEAGAIKYSLDTMIERYFGGMLESGDYANRNADELAKTLMDKIDELFL